MKLGVAALLVCAGCTQLFGLDDPTRAGVGDAAIADGLVDTPLVDEDALTGPIKVRRIDIAADKVTAGPHTDFPVLVDLDTTWLRSTQLGGDVANTSGYDIYFSSDQAGTNRLDHEIEQYGVDGIFTAWVRIPSLTTSTAFFLHYGDSTITTSQEAADAVWGASYAVVMHMGDTVDATGNAAATSMLNLGTGVGRIYRALAFNGTDSVANMGSLDAIDGAFDNGGAIEAWVNPTGFGENSWGRIAQKGEDSGWALFLNNNNGTNSFSFLHGSNNASFGQWTGPANSIALDTWQHVAAVFDRTNSGSTPTLYVNGVSVAVTQQVGPSGAYDNDSQHDLYIGERAAGDRAFAGRIDEVRLSSSTRSAGWFATQYANQSNPATFYTVSGEL